MLNRAMNLALCPETQASYARSMLEIPVDAVESTNMSGFTAFKPGFITNSLKPKTTVFFLNIFD